MRAMQEIGAQLCAAFHRGSVSQNDRTAMLATHAGAGENCRTETTIG